MPNHVTHRVVVRGPAADVAAFKARAFVRDEEAEGSEKGRVRFDFNAFVPMPECLNGSEASSVIEDGLRFLGRGDLIVDRFSPKTAEEALRQGYYRNEGANTVAEARAKFEKRWPTGLEQARRAIANAAETGHADWYGWSREHWGTKWNSYDFAIVRDEAGEIEFIFDTAWSVPKPVLAAAAAAFPALTFKVEAFDEGGNFGAIGAYTGGIGAVDVRRDLGDDAALYERVYGKKKPIYDEDGEEVEQ